MNILLQGADRRSQWYGDTYPGSKMTPNVVVLHTTESGDWPSYSGGATAPNLTVKADKNRRRLVTRQHYSLDRSSRALRNEWGGVETNTLNVIQLELVGSCDRRDGYGAIYWPDAPEWCYEQLGEILASLRRAFPAIPLNAPTMWLAYGPDSRRPGVTPASYGASPARMSFAQWRSFRGICGHQHVPENVHGDPGDLPIDKILRYAGALNQEEALMVTKEDEQKIAQIVRANVGSAQLIDARGKPGSLEKLMRHVLIEQDRLRAALLDPDDLAQRVVAKLPKGSTNITAADLARALIAELSADDAEG